MLPLRGKILNVEKARIDKVLQNDEIQALITAIGTGVRDEFDLERARYHKVILMTDADVDGAHIRTLVLTLLFREMQELIEAGYVYIAKPPLYKLKQGRNERYIEKESELEEVLLSDKFDKLEILDRDGKPVQAHRGALAALHAPAQAVRGLGQRAARRARPRHRALPRGVLAPRRAGRAPSRRRCAIVSARLEDGAVHTTELMSDEDDDDAARQGDRDAHRAWRRRTGSGATLFESPEYTPLRQGPRGARRARRHAAVHGQARRQVRRGAVVRGAARRGARRRAPQPGVALNRFKGLGEMNAEQLRETTMDPETRTLAQVTMEDAAAADRIFSMLMGDVVEFRRQFIEDNALAATVDV